MPATCEEKQMRIISFQLWREWICKRGRSCGRVSGRAYSGSLWKGLWQIKSELFDKQVINYFKISKLAFQAENRLLLVNKFEAHKLWRTIV